MTTFDTARWQARLDELAQKYDVPGASLAVLNDGEISGIATGVLNLDTGVETTIDSLFQIGSITKIYTATTLLRLLAGTDYAVDTVVRDILPDFAVADPGVAAQVTIRHLLTHTSGLDGDFFYDTGRGDDCVARYVADCSALAQNHPLGATMSYCNSGFVILGRLIEQLSGKVWDTAVREQLLAPLGATHSVTLPEDALRFRTAMGHVNDPGEKPRPAPEWMMMRALGPAGASLSATPADILALARLHLDEGRGPDGTQMLPPEVVAAMREPQVDVPDPWTLGRQWGLAWILFDWGRGVFGHDGDTIGQSAWLRIVPDSRVALAMAANGGSSQDMADHLIREILGDLAGVEMPSGPTPESATVSPEADPSRFAGVYERASARLTFSDRAGVLHLLYETTGALADVSPPIEVDLVPFTDNAFLAKLPDEEHWTSVVFYEVEGSPYVHLGARATPRVAEAP